MTAVVQRLYEQGKQDSQSLLMAGRCLAEDVQVDPELRGKIIPAMLDTRADFSPEHLERIAILINVDQSVAQDLILGIGGSAPAVQTVRKNLLDGLSRLVRMRKRRFASFFLPIMDENTRDKQERAFAAYALGFLGVEDEPNVWEALKKARGDEAWEVRAAATWAWCALGRYEDFGLVEVPAGECVIGSEKGGENEKPQHNLYLPTFYIDKYPVTVGEWRSFVDDSGHKPQHEGSLRGASNHPVVRVTWYEALKYAQWYGMGLPSEAEWEKAARSTDGRTYPWGDDWQSGLANTGELKTSQWLRQRILRRTVWQGTTPVGRFSPEGDSPYGCADMAGNVWEWTRSLYKKYLYVPDDSREDLEDSGNRVLRGGSWINYQNYARCAVRLVAAPDVRDNILGFRVVVSPSAAGL